MANHLIDETSMTAIAEAIRAKTGSTAKLKPADMASAIEGIENSGGDIAPKWTKISSAFGTDSSRINQLYYRNNMWWIVSSNKGLVYSIDGQNWTICDNLPLNMVSVLIHDGEKYLCEFDANAYGICYSIDGTEWIRTNMTQGVSFISYINGMYFTAASNDNKLYYSLDGITWTVTSATDCKGSLIYLNGKYIYAGSSGSYYSTNGISWTKSDLCASSATYYPWTITCINGLLFATSTNMPTYKSKDGITWTMVNDENTKLLALAYAHGVIAARGTINDNTGLHYSTDNGDTWIFTGVSGTFYKMFYTHGLFFASGNNTTGLYYSVDGKTWNQSVINDAQIVDVLYANGIWLAASKTHVYYAIL